MANKIKCYRPWTSIHVDANSGPIGQGMTPCCWYKKTLSRLNKDATFENTFLNDEWEQARKEMYEANGGLPVNCPIYCQGVLGGDYFDDRLKHVIENYIELGKKWDRTPLEFAGTVANACNLKCKMCWIFDDFDYVINMEGMHRVVGDIKQVIREQGQDPNLPKFTVALSGGEVFYAKPMRETLYALLEDPEIGITHNTGFITNLTIWDQKFWDLLALKPNAISNIVVSIDGWDRESYNDIRGVDKFNTVMENLEKMFQWREDHKETHGYWHIGINSLIQTTTYPHLKEIIDLFIDKPASTCFIPLIVGYKAEESWQCYNLPEHQQSCLDAIRDAIQYMHTIQVDESNQQKQISHRELLESLYRNEAYLIELMKR